MNQHRGGVEHRKAVWMGVEMSYCVGWNTELDQKKNKEWSHDTQNARRHPTAPSLAIPRGVHRIECSHSKKNCLVVRWCSDWIKIEELTGSGGSWWGRDHMV